MNYKNILVTGANGFLGSNILAHLLVKSNKYIFVIIRRGQQAELKQKLFLIFQQQPLILSYRQIKLRMKVIEGDLLFEKLGLKDTEYENLLKNTGEIFHCAAKIDFNLSWYLADAANIQTLKNILIFKNESTCLSKFNYISTLFITGKSRLNLAEPDFPEINEFNNNYEKSKYIAESLVRLDSQANKIPTLIYRPSIITGDSYSGFTTQFNLLYRALRLFSLNLLKEVPINKDLKCNFIPVDKAAEFICSLSQSTDKSETFHIMSESDYSIVDFFKYVSNYFKYKNPTFISETKFSLEKLTITQKLLLQPMLPYFTFRGSFSGFDTKIALKRLLLDLPKLNYNYFEKFCKFCKLANFLKSKNNY